METFGYIAYVEPRHGPRAQRFQKYGNVIREVLGNPFRPWAVNPPWLGGGIVQPDGKVVPVTADVRGLAEGVAADLGFDRLPVLADAAEEAGFDDPALLDHLRNGTGHVRGCWALDVLLGRA